MIRDLHKKYSLLNSVSGLPRKILTLQGRENATEFVLHELCQDCCFNLNKAAYFVDNPDFDCLKGVAGLCKQEAYQPKVDIWSEESDFSKHMKKAPFNKKVRNFCKQSSRRAGEEDQKIVDLIAKEVGIDHPSYYSWDMKHENHGILVYEKEENKKCDCEILLECLCLLGFCPVF